MTKKIKYSSPVRLLAFILLCQFAGILGSIFTYSSVSTWYAALNKPLFNPPGWVFAPVWTLLYTLMGISLYLIWQQKLQKDKKSFLVKFFLIHLVINTSWSLVFFGLHDLFLAAIVILILWMMIAYLIKAFWQFNHLASQLLWPYLAWVSFATILNFSLLVLN